MPGPRPLRRQLRSQSYSQPQRCEPRSHSCLCSLAYLWQMRCQFRGSSQPLCSTCYLLVHVPLLLHLHWRGLRSYTAPRDGGRQLPQAGGAFLVIPDDHVNRVVVQRAYLHGGGHLLPLCLVAVDQFCDFYSHNQGVRDSARDCVCPSCWIYYFRTASGQRWWLLLLLSDRPTATITTKTTKYFVFEFFIRGRQPRRNG